MMLMFCNNIQSPADPLRKVQESYLFHSLVNPKAEVFSAMQQLRIVYSMDASRYSQLKRQLPYVVCGMFNPPYRRTENFAYTENFILDFDHLSSKKIDLNSLKQRIVADNRVMLCFASPSQDGIKVMFRLKDRCYDSGLYKIFYKAFASAFSQSLGIDQVLDARTSDVTRACFVSVDTEAYYSEAAEPVDLTAFVQADNPLAVFDMKKEQAKKDKEQKKERTVDPRPKDPTKDIMDKIRSTLRPNAPVKKQEAYVPAQLNDIISPVCDKIRETGIIVTEVTNIQYAKKIRCQLGMRQGELNLFYGKKGYSVVESPRRGTDDELNHLLADIVRAFLSDMSPLPY